MRRVALGRYIQFQNAVMHLQCGKLLQANCHASLDRSNAIPKPVSISATLAGGEKEGRDTISLPFSRRADEGKRKIPHRLVAPCRAMIFSIDVYIQPSRFAAAFCNRRSLKNRREERARSEERTCWPLYNPLR